MAAFIAMLCLAVASMCATAWVLCGDVRRERRQEALGAEIARYLAESERGEHGGSVPPPREPR